MKVHGTLLARAIQGVHLRSGQYLPDVVHSVRERYGFVGAPSAAEDILGGEKPLVFKHGRLVFTERTCVVNEFSMFSEAFVVDLSTSTDDAELFLDDIVGWGVDQGLFVPADPVTRRFVSQLEVAMSVDLDEILPGLSELRLSLARTLGKYEPELAAAQAPVGVYSVGVSVDPMVFPTSGDFRVERRHGHPFVSKMYFAQAPLRTVDHVAVLEEFERKLTRTAPTRR